MDSTPSARKTCAHCGENLPVSAFYARSDRSDRFSARCKQCLGDEQKQRYQTSRPKPQQLALPSTEKVCTRCEQMLSLECFGERSDQPGCRASHCKDCRRQAKREYNERNAESRREASRLYYRANAEAVGNRIRASIAKKPEKYKAIHKNWKKQNRDATIAMAHRRHAREVSNGGSWTSDDWQRVKATYDWRCLGCGLQEVTDGIQLCFDHIIPLSMGGWNLIQNCQPVCKSCNSLKHCKVLDLRDRSYPFKKGT